MNLFDIPPSFAPKPTVPRKRPPSLTEWKRKHNVKTHYEPTAETGDRWTAVQIEAGDRRSVPTLLSEECRSLDEAGRLTSGSSERKACEELAQNLKLEMP